MNKNKLKEWQVLFCQEYVKNGGNAKKAYQSVRPGTKDESARASACTLLKNDDIKDEIKRIQEEIVKSSKCDVNKRLEVLSAIILTGSEANKIKAIETMNKMEGIGLSNLNQNININTASSDLFSDLSKEDLLRLIEEDDEDDGEGEEETN